VHNVGTRIPSILNDVIGYLTICVSRSPAFSWELIVVDDGSRDGTVDRVLGFARQHQSIRLLRLGRTEGKGAAVQLGCLHSRGRLILTMTAECSLKLREFETLERKLAGLAASDRRAVVFASRAGRDIPGSDFLRSILAFGVPLTGVGEVQDTQCGLKLFSREAAQLLFSNQHLSGWVFDTELLVIARRQQIPMAEVAIDCPEPLPALPLVEALRTALDLVQIAVYYRLGIWSIRVR
jgi:dolichyl-phosphate beta-glucosyltransferase